MFKDNFAFDLISDLYLDHWPNHIQWTGLPTSLIGVVAGDLSADLDRTVYELRRIAENYRQVLYIDGDLEHQSLSTVDSTRNYLLKKLQHTNINYMFEQVVIINNVAFVAANLWQAPTGFGAISDDQWTTDMRLLSLHHADLEFLRHATHRLQSRADVAKIVVVSHTVPNSELINASVDTDHLAVDASDYVEMEDTQHKISHWCFGHWPRCVNYQMDHCKYVSNPRGNPKDSLGFEYFPLRVEI